MRRLAVFALLAPALACDPLLTLRAEIVVPTEVQERVEFPVQVAFESDAHGGASQALCGAEAEPITVVLEDQEIGCAEPMEVRAVLAPWTPPDTGCVVEPGTSYASAADNALASATAMAYEDFADAACQGADETVTLTLE